ncbi:hypothetical protein HYC85_003771 [Camellia sinensis]|uniref:Uncharacterized protein n=1 Tax=Camellia sinensis TaxID=4442 RepID=A0A7J7HWQ5_CAMSI|nr:hypothetical protein HYC85_003771 [Camellia sinensis]
MLVVGIGLRISVFVFASWSKHHIIGKQIRSHLQKYRLSKNLHGHSNIGTNKIGYSKDRSSVVAIGLNVHTALVDDTIKKAFMILRMTKNRKMIQLTYWCHYFVFSDDDDDEDGTEALLLELEQIKKELAIF